MPGIDVGGIFHFYSMKMVFTVDNKIDFGTGFGAPEEALHLAVAVFTPGLEVLHHQPFQGNAIDFMGTVKGGCGAQMLKYTGIK